MKNISMIDWDDFRFFLEVARASSVRKASHSLGVSHSTVLRRITNFEQKIGARLFDRLPSGYFTTEAGDDLLASALRLEQEVTASQRKVEGRDALLSGEISVTMPSVFATHLLMPAFAAFRKAHPGIELKIMPAYTLSDLAQREADVAIRVSNDPPDDLFGRRVLTMSKAAYVSVDYLPNIQNQKQQSNLSWIGWSDFRSSSQWLADSDFPNVPVGAIINDPYATMEAVKLGVGMAILPCFMADKVEGIYRMPPASLIKLDLWVLTHEDLRNTARIRIFMSFITEVILKHKNLLEGNMLKSLLPNAETLSKYFSKIANTK